MMTCLTHFFAENRTLLEGTYFIAQSLLFIIALAAVVAAIIQLKTFKRIEILKILEEPRIRKARKILWDKARPRHGESWWKDDPELEKAASSVSASFDIAWIVAKWMNRPFFKKYWSHSVCWTYKELEAFIEERRNDDKLAYVSYEAFYKAASRKRLGWRCRLGRLWSRRRLPAPEAASPDTTPPSN